MSLITIHHSNPIIPPGWMDFVKNIYPCDPGRGPWIAGGAVRRLWMGQDFLGGDIDYFCASQDQWERVVAHFEDHISCGAKTEHANATSFTFDLDGDDRGEGKSVVIQIIKIRFAPTLEAHLSQFDFTICQTGWDGIHFYATERAVIDLMRRSFSLVGTPVHLHGSWQRILKYAKQGFTPTPETYETFLTLIRNEDIPEEAPYV